MWKPIGECPDDFDRPGGVRSWRLRCAPEIRLGHSYELDEVPAPFETVGRRNLFNDTGWIESATNRELHPIEFAPLPGMSDTPEPQDAENQAMDARTVEFARDLMQRLGEAPGPDRELDLQVFSVIKGQPLEWADAGRTLARLVQDAGTRPAGGDGLPGWGDTSSMPGTEAFALPHLTASTDECVAQVKAAGFITVLVEFRLSDRLRRHVKDVARIWTWKGDDRGPIRKGEGFSPGLAICQALVLALLGQAGHVPEDEDFY